MTTPSDPSGSKFLSLLAHELRAPLNTINGYLDLALSGAAGDLNEQLREFLQRARLSSETLFILLEDLLLLARVDANQFLLSRQILNLSDITSDALETLELTASDQNITIQLSLDNHLPPLYADAARLQHVLRNLLSNALRFTPAGGLISIETRLDTIPADGSPCAKLIVHDTGCGIPPEFHQRLFERFFRVPQPSTGRSGGQGLGLFSVKTIIEAHGGSVSVESSPEKGSTFICTLPYSRDEETTS